MQLPYEIWEMVVAYLPVGDAKKLYSVNSALFDIAMGLRYQEARLQTSSPKALVRKDLRVFQYSHLSSRPRTLYVDLSSVAMSLSRMNEGCNSFGRMIPLIFSLITRIKYDQLSSIAEIIDALPRLTAVTKLHVIYDYNGAGYDDPLILDLIKNVWHVFGDRLRFLQVRVAFDNLELLLPPSLHLPYLEVLRIDADGSNTIPAIGYEPNISSMIKSHSSSLRDVSFTANNIAVDLRPIFRSLQDVHRLQAIHLSFPFGPFVPSPFPAHDMLYSCRHRLESLSLNFGTYRREHAFRSFSLFREDWCAVDLPHLRELKIDPPIMFFGQEFVDYIHQFAPSLISLSINPNLRLRYHEAERLSEIFPDFLSLKNLSICIRYLCPGILALLAQTLPRLQTLHLWYSYISVAEEGMLNDPELPRVFYREMGQHAHIFRKWQLVSLDYDPFSMHSHSAPIEKALADHLPNVERFCGKERSTYLSQAQNLPPTAHLYPTTISFAML